MPIETRVKKVIAEILAVPVASLKNDTQFTGPVLADELDRTNLIIALEDEFELEITDEEAAQMRGVQSTIDLITKLDADGSK